MTNDQAAQLAEEALDSLDYPIAVLSEAIHSAYFASEQNKDSARTIVATLFEIQTEIGPRLVARIQLGESKKLQDLQRLVENVSLSTLELAEELGAEYSIPGAVQTFLGATITDIGDISREAVRSTVPLALIGALVFALVYLKR
jgi:hypothetical protein